MHQIGNCGTDDLETALTSMDTTLLVTMVELVAFEKLVNVRQVMVCELHSEQFPVLNEFQALYAYKCGLLDECLDMCYQNVNMLLNSSALKID